MQTLFPSPHTQALLNLLFQPAQAVAVIQGSPTHAALQGQVRFYQTHHGVLIHAEIMGLPSADQACKQPVFGFHIHSGGRCSGNETDLFADTQGHYNPHDCQHPYHAGDLPPLFGVGGRAFSVFLTDRFFLSDVLGKTVVIHAHPDDFHTQPSGNSGEKIACGVIRARC